MTVNVSQRLGANAEGWQILAHSASPVSGPGDTNENTLVLIPVPGNVMGPNGALRITTLWTVTNSGNNKVVRTRFSGAAGTIYGSQTLTTSASYIEQRLISNRNAPDSQVGPMTAQGGAGGWGASTGAVVTTTENTRVETSIALTAQKASAGETITLERYLVEVLYGA